MQESDEVYFLSASTGVAKLRNNLMDIKLLREVDVYGLERWEPVMKAEFPLGDADVAATFERLQLAWPNAARGAWTVDEFVKVFAGTDGPLRAVSVHKRRVRYAISGCTMELTDVVVDGKPAFQFEAGGPLSASPALADGRLVIGSQDGKLFCLG